MAPDRAIALAEGRLIEVEVPAGRSVGELDVDLGASGPREGVRSLAYSRERGSLLFSRATTAASREIVEVPLEGGQPEVVAEGLTVAPAPDGERIAVGRRELGTGDRDREVLEIRTLDGDVLGRWADPISEGEPLSITHDETERAITQLDFDHTGQHLLYVQGHAHVPREDDDGVGPPELRHWHGGVSTDVMQEVVDVAR